MMMQGGDRRKRRKGVEVLDGVDPLFWADKDGCEEGRSTGACDKGVSEIVAILQAVLTRW